MNDAALVVPNFTAVAPVSAAPVITTEAPHGPLTGSNDVISGFTTEKSVALKFVPFGVVTLILPVVVPVATTAVILFGLSTVNDAAAVVLNFTAVAPVKLFPLIVTAVPTGPLVGENDAISGVPGTVNFVALEPVPDGVVTPM